MKPRQITVEIVGDSSGLKQAIDEAGMKAAEFAALFHIRQALKAVETEIAMAPPFSTRNAERRGELDQLRDMIDRRT